MMNLDTPENYAQDDKNFQNTYAGNQGKQKAFFLEAQVIPNVFY
ncbi:MAG: hypothetical protein ABI850_02015 [Flavobacterium sp.]